MALAVLLPGAVAQELPEVVPDCPSQVQPKNEARQPLAITYDQPGKPQQFSSSNGHPDLLSSKQPLRPAARFNLFLYRTGSKVNLSRIALSTQYSFQDEPYGPGFPGYTKLYAAKLADSASRNFFEVMVLSRALGQDPRHYRSTADSTWGRFRDAATGVAITRTEDGRKTFNTSRVLATFLSSALANTYYPAEERGVSPTMKRAGRRLMLDVSSGVVREFAPDLLRKLFRKKPAGHSGQAVGE